MTTRMVAVPEALYAQLEQRAQAMAASVDAVIIQTLTDNLLATPEVDLPQAMQNELAAMNSLSDQAIWAIAQSNMNSDSLAFYDLLIERKQEKKLTSEGQQWLTRLTYEADALTLRKAHAYLLLKQRGYQLPHLTQLPFPNQ